MIKNYIYFAKESALRLAKKYKKKGYKVIIEINYITITK